MFNPFFTTKPAGEGTGLGLSMSHDIIVKQHGGKIDVETEPSSFTEFIITLPRAAAAQAHIERNIQADIQASRQANAKETAKEAATAKAHTGGGN